MSSLHHLRWLSYWLINRNTNCSVTARPSTSDPGCLGSSIQVRGDLTSFLAQKIQSESQPWNELGFKPAAVAPPCGDSRCDFNFWGFYCHFRCRRASIRSMGQTSCVWFMTGQRFVWNHGALHCTQTKTNQRTCNGTFIQFGTCSGHEGAKQNPSKCKYKMYLEWTKPPNNLGNVSTNLHLFIKYSLVNIHGPNIQLKN